jgi:hypothetical protein
MAGVVLDLRRRGAPRLAADRTMLEDVLCQSVRLIGLSLAVGAVSVTVSKTKACGPLRRLAARGGGWLRDLVHCPYCLSHWLALAAVAIYRPRVTGSEVAVLDFAASLFILVALAAWWSKGICQSLETMDAVAGEPPP